MEKANDGERKDIRSIWTQMIQKLGRYDIHDFLRTMWVSRHGDLKKDDLFTALKSHIEKHHINAIDFARECGDESDDYIHLMTAEEAELPKDSIKYVRAITRELGLRAAVPLLLSSYVSLTSSDFEDVAKFILVFATRYSIIGNRDSSGMEDLYFELARDVRAMAIPCQDKTVSAAARNHVKAVLSKHAPDAAATAAAAESSDLGPADAKYVISRIGQYMQDPEKQVTLGETNLEHIYPQNPDPAKWGGIDNQEKMEPLTWNIGNLTVFGKRANSKVANDEFPEKAKRYGKSKVQMTSSLATEYTQWDADTVVLRAKRLAKLVVLIWDFANPSRV